MQHTASPGSMSPPAVMTHVPTATSQSQAATVIGAQKHEERVSKEDGLVSGLKACCGLQKSWMGLCLSGQRVRIANRVDPISNTRR